MHARIGRHIFEKPRQMCQSPRRPQKKNCSHEGVISLLTVEEILPSEATEMGAGTIIATQDFF